MYKAFVKPLFDILFGSLAFVVLFPIFLIVALLLTIHLKGSPFFFQRRPGKNERIFKIVKFKTMTDAKDTNGNLLPDNERLTSLGKWVRSTSLDEIPQLLNVIKGEMSFVGPRPLLPQYLSLYNDFQKQRHNVTPGITGWAQVNGRNAISWEKKFEYDVYYAQHISFLLDLKILFKTVAKVFLRKDISEADSATATPFKGTQQE
ncbi:sugar transferase [Aureisphaera galaxeae]|uniref:sugar transferase n=1 Tax=Aureisphaera galaxeae TaxID=1538023 RepID=UPI0023505846|nr:sugar transferase [Aureisphaera galaxeae]MDC8004587.1 sugar transferase [Aureisphaera galaxeae]